MLEKFSNLRWLLLSLVIVVIDQLIKYIMVVQFTIGETKPIFSFLSFTFAHNYGVAFSFLNEPGGWQRWMFSGIALGVSGVMIIWLLFLNAQKRLLSMSLAFIIGGAIGNVIDRLQYGYVIDFLDFHLQDYHWPIFNIADTAVCIGAILLFISFWKNS